LFDYSKAKHLLNNKQLAKKQLTNRTMATLYNKTALNKIKKADLIQMFIEQQGQKNYLVMENDEFKQRLIEKNDQLIEANEKQIELTKENKKLHESFDGWTATLEEYKMLKVENKKLKKDLIKEKEENVELMEENKKLKEKTVEHLGMAETLHDAVVEENKKLKEEIEGWKEVAETYSIETSDELESWLSASIHEDDEVYSKYMEPLELRDEVEELKKQNEKLKKEIGYNDTEIARKNWQIDHAYKQLNELMSKATLLKDEIESKEESDSESEEDECVCCGTNFILNEELHHASPERRTKYEDYFGSEADMGDICPECLDKIY
jgi:DNA repair exonuclease SbcCD ATPase subunit